VQDRWPRRKYRQIIIMDSDYVIRYVIRVNFPDDDLFCFVLDKLGNIIYYNSKESAETIADSYSDTVIIEIKYYGF